MTTRIILASAAALLAGLLAGCGSEPENATEKPSEQPAAQANILDGPIPSCERLITMDDPAMKAYRMAAHKECSLARSFQEKLDNVGCQVNNKISTQCASKMKGSEIDAWAAEKKAALGE